MKKTKDNKVTNIRLFKQFEINCEQTPCVDNKAVATNTNITKTIKTTPVEDTHIQHKIQESLMPELEELVKKNPNRLIGCGG